MNNINIDDFVNYESEYKKVVKKAVVLGSKMTGLCPFHSDSNNSFSVDLKTGKWHCFTEDIAGNFLDFYGRVNGCDTKEAYKQILKEYGKFEEQPESDDYSLEKYAEEKGFNIDWLKDNCHLSTGKKKKGTKYLKIPYYNEKGEPTVYRERYARKNFRWGYGARGKINLYGEWRLSVIKQAGYAILVEGESDSQSLWRMDLPALGVPGAKLFKPDHAKVLLDIPKLYIHKEQDGGGEEFIKKTIDGLRRGGYEGEVYIFTCGGISGCKDPSDIYMKNGADNGKNLIIDLIKNAENYDLDEADPVPENIKGAPVDLRNPDGFYYDESGIYEINEKGPDVHVCGTPIIITKRVKSLDDDGEKIGIAVLRSEGNRRRWTGALFKRSEIYTTKATTILTDMGAMVHSENIRQIIRFLSGLETANDDIIPWGEVTSTLGWHSNKRFIPGMADGLETDFDDQMGAVVAAYHEKGSLNAWIETMQEHREKNRFRFLIATSFATPLIKPLHHRTFFVYNWGDARGGKTAALKASLSVWGDPDGLMMNFNTTQVGLERQAALFTDLPLGIDERQAAGTGEKGQSKIENFVYMIGEGKGRTRGAKEGGIQKINKWRTIALATGEEPLTTETSMTGIMSRVIEICKGPFKDEIEASKMHVDCSNNYGLAGPEFVKILSQIPEEAIRSKYDEMVEYVRGVGKGKAGSHVSGIALIALADALANDWIFEKKMPEIKLGQLVVGGSSLTITTSSWERAKAMAKEVMKEQVGASAGDVNENASKFLADWVFINKASFTEYSSQRLGKIEGDKVLIVSTAMTEALKQAGYNERKVKSYMAEKGYINQFFNEKTGKTVYSKLERIPIDRDGGTFKTRVVEFYINRVLGDEDDDYDEDDEWKKVDGDDLPFV